MAEKVSKLAQLRALGEARAKKATAPSPEVQPELCHGKDELNLSSAMVGQDVAGDSPMAESQPRVSEHFGCITQSEKVNRPGLSFGAALKGVRITPTEFAELARTPLETVRGWCKGRYAAPGCAWALLLVLNCYPDLRQRDWGEAWKGLASNLKQELGEE